MSFEKEIKQSVVSRKAGSPIIHMYVVCRSDCTEGTGRRRSEDGVHRQTSENSFTFFKLKLQHKRSTPTTFEGDVCNCRQLKNHIPSVKKLVSCI